MNAKSQKKNLILFTSSFPFGNGEAFLESEIGILSFNFRKIIVICSDITSLNQRAVPDNVSVVREKDVLNSWQKIKSIFSLLSIELFEEFLDQKHNLGFLEKRKNLNYLVKSWYKRKLVSSRLEKVFKDNNFHPRDTCLYSYWWLDESIGIAQFKKKQPEVIAFSRCHGYDVYTERSAGNYLPLKKFTIKYLDHIYAISDDAKNYIDDRFIENDALRSKISVSRLGVKMGKLILIKERADTFTIVSCSAIYPNKRVDLILESVLKMKSKVKWIHFGGVISGFSDDYFKKIQSKVDSNSNQNIEIELKGNISNLEILSFYANNPIDIFLNLSKSEGVPVSIMEAMSYSIPVFATNVGGVPEIVNESNGELLDVNISSTMLSNKIDGFFNLSLDLTNKKRDAAFDTYCSQYDAAKNYRSFVSDILKLK